MAENEQGYHVYSLRVSNDRQAPVFQEEELFWTILARFGARAVRGVSSLGKHLLLAPATGLLAR